MMALLALVLLAPPPTAPASSGGGGAQVPAACSAGQVVTSNGSALVCTGTITANSVSGGNVSGAVATATALASNPADCGVGEFATSIAANGNLTCALPTGLTAVDLVCAGTCVADAEIAAVSGAKVSGAVATATALASNPTDCGANQFANAIDASGNLACAAPAGGGPTVLAADVPCAVSASYCAIFSVTPQASKFHRLNFRLIMTNSGATTVGLQFRVRSADAVGSCWFVHPGIAGTAASATGHEVDVIAISANPGDNAAAASFAQNTAWPMDVNCAFLTDAAPDVVVLEFQLETGTASASARAGSSYTLVTN